MRRAVWLLKFLAHCAIVPHSAQLKPKSKSKSKSKSRQIAKHCQARANQPPTQCPLQFQFQFQLQWHTSCAHAWAWNGDWNCSWNCNCSWQCGLGRQVRLQCWPLSDTTHGAHSLCACTACGSSRNLSFLPPSGLFACWQIYACFFHMALAWLGLLPLWYSQWPPVGVHPVVSPSCGTATWIARQEFQFVMTFCKYELPKSKAKTHVCQALFIPVYVCVCVLCICVFVLCVFVFWAWWPFAFGSFGISAAQLINCRR